MRGPGGTPSATTSVPFRTKGGVRPISAEFNGEKVTGQTWPAAEGRVVMLEMSQ